jgi:hypothetical protein
MQGQPVLQDVWSHACDTRCNMKNPTDAVALTVLERALRFLSASSCTVQAIESVLPCHAVSISTQCSCLMSAAGKAST